jgi:hypothetical protein
VARLIRSSLSGVPLATAEVVWLKLHNSFKEGRPLCHIERVTGDAETMTEVGDAAET